MKKHFLFGSFLILMASKSFSQSPASEYNTLYGRGAGQSLVVGVTTGQLNAMFGKRAGNKTTTGYQNNFVGDDSGLENISGFGNSFFGFSSGLNSLGNSNTFIGHFAGFGIKQGSNNTFVGAEAKGAVDNLTNATAIGSLAIVNVSNAMVLGNSNVNVGMGTSSPSQKLHVKGNV